MVASTAAAAAATALAGGRSGPFVPLAARLGRPPTTPTTALVPPDQDVGPAPGPGSGSVSADSVPMEAVNELLRLCARRGAVDDAIQVRTTDEDGSSSRGSLLAGALCSSILMTPLWAERGVEYKNRDTQGQWMRTRVGAEGGRGLRAHRGLGGLGGGRETKYEKHTAIVWAAF